MTDRTRRRRHVGRDEGFVFEAPRGSRIHRNFHGITVAEGPMNWWLRGPGVWVADFKSDDRWKGRRGVSSHARCCTLRAFRSHIRRHRAELAGCLVVLCSRYEGHNVSVQL